jgi:phytanoyl-CoA dioxygenase PhyH
MLSTLSEEERALLPSDEDVAFYREHGYFITPKVLPEELLDDALYGVERYYSGERDTPLPISGGFLDWRPEHGERLRINDYVSLQNEELKALVRRPLLGAIAARLCGVPTVRLFHDQLIGKPVATGEAAPVIGWHVDRAYWRTCSSSQSHMLTAWIPLVDCTPEMGPLEVIDRSHGWTANEWMRTFNDPDLDALERKIVADGGGEVRKVRFALERGQVSFHHGGMIHGSRENRGERMRIALTVHFQDGDNRYRQALDDKGRPLLHVNDLLCRKDAGGNPDYTDPDICPVLWEEEAAPVSGER